MERLGDDGDRQDAEFAGDTRDDRRSPCAGAAAHAGGDEQHMTAGDLRADVVDGFLGGGFTDLGL